MRPITRGNSGHMIDIIFTLALFCVFAASALLVVLIGANVYKTTAASMSDNFDMRTSITYISTKIHQNDTSGGVYLETLHDSNALVLEQEIDGDVYRTWIYHYNGELREIFAMKDSEVSPGDGQVIMKVPTLDMESLDGNMLRFTSVDKLGKKISLTMAPRCA